MNVEMFFFLFLVLSCSNNGDWSSDEFGGALCVLFNHLYAGDASCDGTVCYYGHHLFSS